MTVSSSELNSLVEEYRAKHASDLQAHLDHYSRKSALTVEEAIRRASRFEDGPSGRRHAHQRRIASNPEERIEAALLAKKDEISASKDFLQLYAYVCDALNSFRGVGALTTYDTALRLGEFIGHRPGHVFLHRGALDGAKALLGKAKISFASAEFSYIDISALPKELNTLDPHEIENFLCLFAKNLSTEAAMGSEINRKKRK